MVNTKPTQAIESYFIAVIVYAVLTYIVLVKSLYAEPKKDKPVKMCIDMSTIIAIHLEQCSHREKVTQCENCQPGECEPVNTNQTLCRKVSAGEAVCTAEIKFTAVRPCSSIADEQTERMQRGRLSGPKGDYIEVK